jgi:hypothetical protein
MIKAGRLKSFVKNTSRLPVSGSVYRMRVAPGVLQIGLGPGHKESPGLQEPEEPFEVEIAAVTHIVGSRHGAEQIEGLDVVESNAYTVASNSTPKDLAA